MEQNKITDGVIWKQLLAFFFPIWLGMFFQQLYNTADSLIVGNFLDSNALAAVSSSGNLIFLMVGFFNGIAMGAGVVIARYYGARNIESLQKAIHTTIALGLAASAVLTLAGVVLAPQILIWMGNTRGCTSPVHHIFPHLFCRFPGVCYVQCVRGNPAVCGRQQAPAGLPDHLLCLSLIHI